MVEKNLFEFPKVSCIMPTYNRRRFAPQAIKYFLEQDYPAKELIIVDDGSDTIEDLVPRSPEIKHLQLPNKKSIGEKRNIAIENSRGEIIIHWDDDDWHAQHRIRYQATHLIKNRANLSGSNRLYFYDLKSQNLWLYEFPIRKRTWLIGGSLCYLKSFWLDNKFDNTSHGEDTRFLWKKSLHNVCILPDIRYYIAMIHSGNTCPKSLSSSYWKRVHSHPRSLFQNDWSFYQNFANS